MCAEYNVVINNNQIKEALGVPLSDDDLGKPNSNRRIRLSMPAPIVIARNGKRLITDKIFPVNPFPNSRLSGLATGSEDEVPSDRDIRRIYDMPMWKQGFSDQPVLVPMSSFFEPVYWGKEIGTVQEFKIPDSKVMFAAGMLITPRIPKSEPLGGFSILTHTATEQMLNYHQRLVVILKPGTESDYLKSMTARERFDFLIENRYTDAFHVTKDRTMAKGWEKKISIQEAKLRREQAYLDTLKNEGTEG